VQNLKGLPIPAVKPEDAEIRFSSAKKIDKSQAGAFALLIDWGFR
jgi:hypothetical protein